MFTYLGIVCRFGTLPVLYEVFANLQYVGFLCSISYEFTLVKLNDENMGCPPSHICFLDLAIEDY